MNTTTTPASEQSRKPKPRPRLPLSVFTPPSSATSDAFLVPSPTIDHPTSVIDANVIVRDGDLTLTQWKKEAGQVLCGRLTGVVLSLPGADLEEIINQRVLTFTPTRRLSDF